MGRRGSRSKLARGIHQDATRVSIIVSVNGVPREFRYPLGKPVAWYRAERIRIHAREQQIAERHHARRDTLKADIDRYLLTLSGRTKDDTEDLLDHWAALHDRPRAEITAVDLRQHAATWTCAASSYNHRRQALISLYRALDGPHAPNPARELPKRQEQPHAPKALPYDVIRKTFDAMPESQSKARLQLMAYTGLPQMQIEKLTPEDWQGARLRVTPRRKGAGAAGRWLPLSPEAQAALGDFARLQCWGPFSRSSLHKAWCRYGPQGSNPYSLRHSWITELYRRSNGDVLALQQLALHSRIEQTQRYAAAALEDRMAALVVPRNGSTKSTSPTTKQAQKLHLNTRSNVAPTGRKSKRKRKKTGRN